MKLSNSDVPSLSQASASVTNGEDSPQPVRRKSTGRPNRVRGVERMLMDIQTQIERLRHERTYLRLVRDELGRRKVERKGVFLLQHLVEGQRLSCSGATTGSTHVMS